MLNRWTLLLFLCLAWCVLDCLASLNGPGHRKGLYGISRRKPKKNSEKTSNSTAIAKESSLKNTTLPVSKAEKVDNKSVDVKGKRRSLVGQVEGYQSSKAAGVADINGPKKRDISLKEVKVGYKKTLQDKSPDNATQVIEITGNLTSSAHKSYRDGSEGEANKVASQSEGPASKEGESNKARSATTNIITDLKVPQMGAAVFGETENNNGSAVNAEGNSSNVEERADTRASSSNMITDLKVPNMLGKDESNGNVSSTTGTQVSSGNNSDNANQRSPQVPNLGASIVGIVDNTNGSRFASRQTLPLNRTAGGNGTDMGERQQEGGGDSRLKDFLDTLDEIANTTAETAKLVNATAQEMKNASSAQGTNEQTENAVNSTSASGKDVNAKKKHEIIGPHYYEPECDDKKKCPDGHYCRMYVCVDCHRNKHACTHREQCCNKMECVYGRCEDKPKGSPGAFCEKDSECAGEACCVLEPTVDDEHSICKPKLSEFHQCSPVLFRKIWIGDHKPECGPCKGGLKCVQRGVEGNHEVCMKKP